MSASFLVSLKDNFGGVATLLVIAIVVVALIRWLAYIFAWGRFRPRPEGGEGPVGEARADAAATRPRETTISYMVANMFVTIINDFRHLLALLIILVFSFAVIWTIAGGSGSGEESGKALQAVVATLGGIVGSVLGYYFGESAAGRRVGASVSDEAEAVQSQSGAEPGDDEQQEAHGELEDIEDIEPPEALAEPEPPDDTDTEEK